MTTKNIIFPEPGHIKKYILHMLPLFLAAVALSFFAPARLANAQAIGQYFEQKAENFIFHNPVFFEHESKPAFVSAETGALKAFVSGSESPLWRFGIRNELKPKKLSASLDRSKFMLQYENNAFEVIGADGAALYSDMAPAQRMLSTPSPEGFIFVKNNFLCSIEGAKCEKNETPLTAPAFALNSIVTSGGGFYYSVLTASGFDIFQGASARSAPLCAMRSQISAGSEALLYFSGEGAQPLKYAIGENNSVKIYDCSKSSPEFKTEFKTDSAVNSLYGANGLPGQASVIIAGCENAYHGFSDAAQAALFKLETRAKSSYLPAALYAAGVGPFFFYYKNNDTAALYDMKSQKQVSEYKLENKTLAGPVSGRYLASKNAAFFLLAHTNSILCLQAPAPGASEDFYFSSEQRFASPYKAVSASISFKTPDILKDFDISALLRLYASYKKETHLAAGSLLLLALIFAFIKRLRRRANGNGAQQAPAGDQIVRLREMLSANPENVELTLNIIQLLKKDNKPEEAAEYYKNLIKLRPGDELYYEELLDLNTGYFQFVGELCAIYKKKAKIKNVISAYESRKNSLKPEDKSYIFVIKILARLYLEDKPYQGESQQGSGENAKKAAAVLEEITAAEPNSIEDLAMLADLYLKSAEYEKAVTVYKKLTEIDKSQGLINHYQTLFMIYNKLSQTEEALEIFRVVMELKNSAIESLLAPANEFFNESFKNGNKKAVLLYGDCIISAYNRQKNVKAAMAAIDRILSVYPQEKAIIKRKGFLMLENDVETNIVEIFKDLCELFPGDIRIRYEYCRLLFKNKKFDESLAIIFDSFKKKENEDKYVELFSQISSILIKEKKYQRVIDLAPVAYKLSQSCVCLKCLAEAYLKSGDIDRANEIYLKTIELSPRDGEAEKRQKYIKNLIDERGILEMKSSSSEELELAIDGETVKVKRSSIDVESRVQVSPLEIQAAEAKLYYEKGDYKKAISIFQQLIKAAPESKRTLVMNIYLMNCFLKENLTAAAEKVYNSIDLKPLNLSAGEELAFKYKAGGIFLECGQLEKAEAIFSEIAAVDMGYKNAGEIITSIKEKIAARKAESLRQQQAPATDDSERTMIATIANETDYIDKRYKILGQIGKGGMGIVYKAIDTANQAQVAIKIPILTFKDDRGFMERFEREADVSSRLKHPNILNIFDVVKGELPYMVMELLVGHSLKEILKEKKSFTHIEMRDIAVQCCDALAYTHGLNIIHRDIKPENIMIVENDAVKIMDFGLAKALDESSVTKAGTIMGTFAYISPEQCLGEQIDGRADLYSLGIMLYEMLTGEKPFTSGDYVHQHLKVKPQAPTKKNPLIPYPVEAIVLKCIEKKPQDRYSSASELKDALLKIA